MNYELPSGWLLIHYSLFIPSPWGRLGRGYSLPLGRLGGAFNRHIRSRYAPHSYAMLAPLLPIGLNCECKVKTFSTNYNGFLSQFCTPIFYIILYIIYLAIFFGNDIELVPNDVQWRWNRHLIDNRGCLHLRITTNPPIYDLEGVAQHLRGQLRGNYLWF